MKPVVIICLLIFNMQTYAGTNMRKSNVRPGEFMEVNERQGLPNFFAKALRGDSLNIAYLGGSITEQSGWRVYSLEWFKQRFPKARFSEVNAAIGGTGSDFGVFRLHEQVLDKKPDLLFVEFAVNDSKTPSEKIIRSMEGIVRQTWKYDPNIDICFVYTLKDIFIDMEKEGNLFASAATMEQVADKYGIPSVNFGFEVAKMVADEKLIVKADTKESNGVQVFSRDGVHPYPETGHKIYEKVLERSMEKMLDKKPKEGSEHQLPKPMAADYFGNTKMIGLNNVQLGGYWEIQEPKNMPLYTQFGKFLQKIGKTTSDGQTLTLWFKGTAIGACDILGPESVGNVVVEIDGQVKDTIKRFDQYCTYRRISYFLVDNLEDKEHEVVFKPLTAPFEKAALMGKSADELKKLGDYDENSWYVGKILLNGDLQTGCWLERPPLMDPENTITVVGKCFGDPGFPTAEEMGGKDVKIILPKNRVCNELFTIGGTNDKPAHNIWIVGGKIEYNGELPGPPTAALTLQNWTGTFFIEGIEIDVHNASMDGIRSSTAVTNGENRRVVIQNSYIRGMGYGKTAHGDLYHAQHQNDTKTWAKELVVQNVRGDLITQGFFIPYRANNSHGVKRASFDHVDLHLDPRYKYEQDRIATMIFVGYSPQNGDSPPPDGQSYHEVYLNWWDPWYPTTSERKDITIPSVDHYDADGCAVFSDTDIRNSKINGAWRKGVPPGGTFVPANKVGLNYDRSFFDHSGFYAE